MESKGKELLPRIMEVVNTLRLAKPSHVLSSETTTSTKQQFREENSSYKVGVDFDLSLPIDLPGFVSSGSKKDSIIGLETTSKSVKIKQKHVDSSAKGGGMKAKVQVSDSKPPTESLKDTKIKDKEGGGQKLLQSSEGKKECKTKFIKPKKVREEIGDKESQDKQKEIASATVERAGEKERNSEGVINKKDKRGEGTSDRMEKKAEGISERKEKNFEAASERKVTTAKVKETKTEENSRGVSSSGNSCSRNARNIKDDHKKEIEAEKKPLPPRRRSARLSSLTEEQKQDEPSDIDELVEEAKKQQLSVDEFEVRATRTRGNRKRKTHGTNAPSRKRAKAYLDSSSEESGEEISLPTERVTLEASEERHNIRKSGHRKRPYKPAQDAARDSKPMKRAKTLSRTASPASTSSSTSSALVTEELKVLEQTRTHRRITKFPERLPGSSRGTSKSPIKSPPPPVVITRSNRHVKPNRRYYDMSEEEEEEKIEHEVGSSSGQSDDEVSATYEQKKNLKKS